MTGRRHPLTRLLSLRDLGWAAILLIDRQDIVQRLVVDLWKEAAMSEDLVQVAMITDFLVSIYTTLLVDFRPELLDSLVKFL